MKRAYRHLFFDLDHTLWDFHHNSQFTIHQLYQRFELKGKLPLCEPAIFYERYLEINDGKWQLYRLGRITKEEVRSQRFYETFQSFGLPDRD
ncbi:MAG: hypothetical protein U5L96_10370 [Owenweeksia sp.]|nr:hypothetical protein [Owenweeksia sp.]